MTKEELNKKVSTIQECIIEVPLAEVFVNGESIGLHNEYSVRRIQLAVKKGELSNDVTFLFKGKESKIIFNEYGNCVIRPHFEDGFFDLSYELAFALID